MEPGTELGPYELVERLGAGGMGVVYRARDSNLRREVAVKLLPEELADDQQRLARLKREARSLAALNHPHIASVYGFEEHGDTSFIVMELVEGETLAEKLEEGPFPVEEALELAVQVAKALEAAHERGIVHRDLKPANIKITPSGDAKVLDFGLAKTLREDVADVPESELPTATVEGTRAGVIVGTAPYMSPEQARGEQVDQQTDIWAFGCLLFEVLSGWRAFRGDTFADTLAAVLGREPDWERLPQTGPPAVRRLLARCLAKDREARLRDMGDVRLELEEVLGELREARPPDSAAAVGRTAEESGVAEEDQTVAPFPARTRMIGLGGLAVALSLLVIAVFDVGGIRSGLGSTWAGGSSRTIDSLAVLPFENETGDPELEYLCNGIAESVINTLSQVPDVKVISRASAFALKNEVRDPQAIGERLDVEAVVLGSLAQRADQISISTELVDVRDNRQLWGEKYHRRLDDVMAIEKDITTTIARRLRVELSGEKGGRLTRRHTDDPEAYRLYLKGRESIVGTEREMDKAIDYFQQAIQKEPRYALAYAGLAEAYVEQAYLRGIDREEPFEKARAAVEKALELDENLAEAHTASGQIKARFDWDWQGAEAEYRRGVELSPGSATTRMAYGVFLLFMGQYEEALGEALKAQELDPLSTMPAHDVAIAYMAMHEYEAAAANFQKTIELDPNWTWGYIKLAKTFAHMNKCSEALSETGKAEAQLVGSVNPLARAWLGYTYALCGETERARDALQELNELSEERYVDPLTFATVHAGLGEKEEVIDWMEEGYKDRAPNMFYVKIVPALFLDELESDPRYQEILRRMNLQSTHSALAVGIRSGPGDPHELPRPG